MHLHKFADLATFDEIGIGGTLPETDYYCKFFKSLHPSQFLNSRIIVPIYEIKCVYKTSRENFRTVKKYMMLRLEHDDVDFEIDMAFQDWVDDLNRRKPYRKISNAEILEINPIAYAQIQIGL